MIDEVVQNKFTSKQTLQLLGFVLVFGLFIGGISAILDRFLTPQIEPLIDVVSDHPFPALAFFYFYVLVASIFVPIPTLPVDLLYLQYLDPASVIVVRVLGGVAGTTISYYLAYRFGRPLLKRWFSKKNYNFVEGIAGSVNWKLLFVIAMLPIINAELMAFVSGLGRVGYLKTAVIMLLAIGYRVMFVYLVTAR